MRMSHLMLIPDCKCIGEPTRATSDSDQREGPRTGPAIPRT
jgi:hypothetical protein